MMTKKPTKIGDVVFTNRDHTPFGPFGDRAVVLQIELIGDEPNFWVKFDDGEMAWRKKSACAIFDPLLTYKGRAIKYLEDKVGYAEPVFILRAQDLLAPVAIDYWRRLLQDMTSEENINALNKSGHAYDIARMMRLWPNRKVPD